MAQAILANLLASAQATHTRVVPGEQITYPQPQAVLEFVDAQHEHVGALRQKAS